MSTIGGIHHVTAIAGDAQENLDFYTGVLGLRLVKRSVNQDVTDTYHLFYADADGHPGADLTFFPWPDLPPGRAGAGLANEVSLAVQPNTLGWWAERLGRAGVSVAEPETRFGERTLRFSDPHGLALALVETGDPREFAAWRRSPVPAAHQVRGIHAVRLHERRLASTAGFLTAGMGFTAVGREGEWHRFAAEGGGSGRIVDLRETPGDPRGEWGVGAVHHVAWRVADEPAQQRARADVSAAGARPTGTIDRFWFRSVYFKEPGGVLFELATDGPGFSVDESADSLGEHLVLPPWLERDRAAIERGLPPLRFGVSSLAEPGGVSHR
ncbi:MAG TPA: ring-cleaving dioxygenase [Gemmatimonadales bacterium]|jgi:glyoxalase family protein|nr:ring-cleaving dioxygenase [Gemmatimonadales bacterium]